jgi:3-deoxy-D-manno-octulosonic-acid transferase
MKLFIYQVITSLAGLGGWPLFYRHLKSRGQGESFLPRLGLVPPPPPLPGSPRVWVHGVSVGEVLAALPLLRELRAQWPRGSFVVSTGTETGQAVARRHYPQLGALVCYFPLDLPWAAAQALATLRPHLFVSLESEVWPTFLSLARRRGVRLALMNARLSDRSFARYRRYKGFIFDFINLFEVIGAGSPLDYERLACLGLPREKLHFTGNLKVDALLARRQAEAPGGPVSRLNLRGEPVLLAASTHPGEEEAVLAAYQDLLGPSPTLLLILAPRHPERTGEVARLLQERGVGFQYWQRLKQGEEKRREAVVLVDTVGDLFSLYGAAAVAFVGGSLVPHGGQNILEPAVWGVPPLYGPYLQNFRWAEEILREAGAGIQVQDAPDLAAKVRRLLDDPERRRREGAAALTALAPHQGAAKRQAELLSALLARP